MKTYRLRPFLLLLCVAVLGTAAAAEPARPAASASTPAVNAIVPNFYYHDLKAARTWYIDKLGFRPLYDDGWVVIVEVAPGMQIALVDGAKGAMRAVEEKGTMLSIETDALEQWYDHVRRIPGIHWWQPQNAEGAQRAAAPGITEHKDIQEFRVLDPGGYLIEFYRWKPDYRPKTD